MTDPLCATVPHVAEALMLPESTVRAMACRPRLLDLFCGAGGAAMGYHRAGFDVVGVDLHPQPHYPFEFHQADALTFPLDGFDAIHASPPCQAYIRGGLQGRDHPDLLPKVRLLLNRTGLPWVIENVPGAPMRPDALLCGSMFGLPVRRHRWFETSPRINPWTLGCNHSGPIHGVYGGLHGKAGAWPGMLPDSIESRQRALGIDWMPGAHELSQAIPPAYTEWIGAQLLRNAQASLGLSA
jgi:hypothetical protein